MLEEHGLLGNVQEGNSDFRFGILAPTLALPLTLTLAQTLTLTLTLYQQANLDRHTPRTRKMRIYRAGVGAEICDFGTEVVQNMLSVVC